jgi:hypothetical protein
MVAKRVRNERGAGNLGCLLMLVLLGGGVYAGYEIFMPQFRNNSFTDRLTETFPYFTRQSEENIRRRIIEVASDFDIALKPEQVKIKIAFDHLAVDIDYVKVADLKFWRKEMPFHITRSGPW